MLRDEDYSSDGEQSDEDYNPNGNHSEAGSEVDSDGDAESGDDEVLKEKKAVLKGKRKKGSESNGQRRKSRRLGDDGENADADNDDKPQDNEPVDEEAEKKRVDDLWADFLSDTAESRPKASTIETSKSDSGTEAEQVDSETTPKPSTSPEKEESKVIKQTITEILDFAGEKVEVQKTVEIPKASASNKTAAPASSLGGARKSGGIGSFLSQLGGARKIGVLEKSKLDWKSFKNREGIDEELQTHNRGKDGYLERQDFLQRTDLRQFELEKSQRQTTRRK